MTVQEIKTEGARLAALPKGAARYWGFNKLRTQACKLLDFDAAYSLVDTFEYEVQS